MSDAVTSQASRSNTKNDIGWKYCHAPNDSDTNTAVCNYCAKIMNGGITRAKNHLMGRKGDVAACKKCPTEVREELWAYVKEKENTGPGDSKYVSLDDSDDDTSLPPSRKNVAELKGLMDLFCRKPETAIGKRKKEKLKQVSIREACDKEATARVHELIARFWYHGNLSFNLVKHPCLGTMVAGIGSFGPHLQTPSPHEMRVPLLNNEVDYTKNLMSHHGAEWKRIGCSVMFDAWTDSKQRCIVNFLVNSQAGTMFVKSMDASDFDKTGQKLFELLDSPVQEIGEENVVQVITDNGSNYVDAGKLLEDNRPHLYWTPCAAHCIDLMLEDIGKLPLIRKTIKSGIFLVGFIYAHSSTLSLLRHFTNKREMVKHVVTRFATSFLSLERLHQEKSNLRRMFTSEEWNKNKFSKDAKGREAMRVVLRPSYWNNVVCTLKVMALFVRGLRLVDGEKNPTMGYIYEAMDKAKEAIMTSFSNGERKYKDVFEVIDKMWNLQLHRPLHVAAHFLNSEFFLRTSKWSMTWRLAVDSWSALRGRGKEKVVEDEEVEFEDQDDESQKEEDFVDLEDSDGEEEEGDALLNDNMENDYVGLEEED
ncbi:hAT transposon superfamily [Striga hermonthica]|uniref:HAT transposon superfamily n=1 Tax=Striga hermonthica TaxID=68872 RepID=A0A9N7NF44_STRHE|nr:hAT transposon superfamily [Striga hermonthica]